VYTVTTTKHLSLNQCINFADESLYQAKAAGRNQVMHYDAINAEMSAPEQDII